MFRLAVLLRKDFLIFFFQAVEDSWKMWGNCELQK